MNRIAFYVLLLLLSGAVISLCLWHSWRGNPAPVLSSRALDESAQPSTNFNNSADLSTRGLAALSLTEIRARLTAFKDVWDIDHKPGFAALLRRWAELDRSGAFDFATSLEDCALGRQAVIVVGDVLSHSDPLFLAGRIRAMLNSESKKLLIHELAGIWLQTDVTSAIMWAEQLPDDRDKEDVLVTIRAQLAAQDPEAASVLVAHLAESDSTSGLVATISEHWASSDPAKAIAWANTLLESEKALALSQIAGVWAQRDPQAAAEFVAAMSVGDLQNEAARSVVSSWAAQDPQAAGAWVLQFPEGDLREHGINVVVTDWTMADAGKALDWVASLPDGRAQSIASKAFAESIGYSASDPLAQEKAMGAILQVWSENDPAAASDWLAGWNATQDAKARVKSFLTTN